MSYHKEFDKVSKTMLSVFAKSHLEFYHTYRTKRIKEKEPTRIMDLGSVVHDVLLEGDDPGKILLEYPESCFKRSRATKEVTNDLNPTAAAAFREANPGKYILKPEESIRAMFAINAVMAHEIGAVLSNPYAHLEEPIYWKCPHTGLAARAKPDIYCEFDEFIIAYDLKTTGSIHPADFKRVAKSQRYWLQDDHYSTGLSHLHGGKPVKFVFWAVETDFPFRIVRYEYTPASKEQSRSAYINLMADLRECEDSGNWEDKFSGETNYLDVAPWDLPGDGGLRFETDVVTSDEVASHAGDIFDAGS